MNLNIPAALVLVAVILTLGACAIYNVPGAAVAVVGLGGAVALFFQGRGVRKSIPPPPMPPPSSPPTHRVLPGDDE